MIKAFEAYSDLTLSPLTIFAGDSVEASRIFKSWAEHHHPNTPEVEPEIMTFSMTELALQPQLAEAAGAGVSGVAYWTGHRAGWIVAAPKDDRLGALTPMDTDVRCYSVFDEDGEMLVFAVNIEQATAFYCQWSLIAHGAVEGLFTVKEMSRWLLRGPQVTLREDMDAGLLGVGSVSEDGFWRICPVDHEPRFER